MSHGFLSSESYDEAYVPMSQDWNLVAAKNQEECEERTYTAQVVPRTPVRSKEKEVIEQPSKQ